MLNNKIKEDADPEANLREYVNLRMSYFRSLLNLSRLSFDASKELKSIMGDVWINFRNKEVEIIKKVIHKGIKKGVFNVEKIDDTSALFVDVLKGLRNMEINKKRIFIIDDNEYEELSRKSNDFVDIFINGLKYK
jgi:hypothetical protein